MDLPSIINKKRVLRHLVPLLFFTLFFLSLFSQFPLDKSIPGNCDSWLVISLSNTYMDKLRACVTDEEAGRAMFPVENVLAYGESAPGSALIFIFYRLLGLNDYLAYYGYISTIFILTAFGVYLLATLYVEFRLAALFAGFAFACSNLFFAHIDDSIIFFYFLPALSIFFLVRYFREQKKEFLFISALIGGLEVYFSVYVFIYETIALMVFFVCRFLNHPGKTAGEVIRWCSVYGIVACPFFLYYLSVLHNLDIVIPFDPSDVITRMSLNLRDPFLILPGNLLYKGIEPPSQGVYWMFVRHYAFIGWLVILMALVSLFKLNRENVQFWIIALLGIFLAFGFTIQIGDMQIHTPYYYLYRWIPYLAFLRVTIRAYFLFSFAVSILSAMGLSLLMRWLRCTKGKSAFLLVAAVIAVHFVENTPFPLKGYPVGQYVELPEEYRAFTDGAKGSVILDLPSRFSVTYSNWNEEIFQEPSEFIYKKRKNQPGLLIDRGPQIFLESHKNLFEYNRDIIYMNWQTKHKQNIVGGINGYFPTSRVIFQRKIMDLPKREALQWLKGQGVTHIVFHKDMVFAGEESLLDNLKGSPYITNIREGERLAVFTFVQEENEWDMNKMGDVIERASSFLERTQRADGSWVSYKARDSLFSEPEEQPSIYPSMIILMALKGTGYSDGVMAKQCRHYIKINMLDNHLWSLDGKGHDFTYKYDRYPCLVEPDSDTTAVGWLLTGNSLDKEMLPSIAKIYDKYRADDGAFKSYFLGLMYGERSCPADYDNSPSLGSNINILAFFSAFGIETENLLRGIEKMTAEERYWERAVYYKKLPYLAYLASNAAECGTESARSLMETFLRDFEATDAYKTPAEWETLQLAAYIKARSHLCAISKESPHHLVPLVRELMQRQREDGGFPASPVYEAGYGLYFGSSAETTAIALKAINDVKTLLSSNIPSAG